MEGVPEEVSGGDQVHWLPQWLALLLGVVVQPYFAHYQQHREWNFDGFLGWALFALIAAIIAFPSVYRNAFDPKSPIIVQIIPIFTAGLGWQSLLATAAKAANPS
jgi:hypothetical protein